MFERKTIEKELIKTIKTFDMTMNTIIDTLETQTESIKRLYERSSQLELIVLGELDHVKTDIKLINKEAMLKHPTDHRV